jgi:Flp pilus assembly protein TadG
MSTFDHTIPAVRPGRGAPRPRRRREAGVSAVEFALVLPLLLVILFGVIDFGFMLYDKAMITNAAREGARAGIVLRNPRLTKAQVEAVAASYCNGRLIRMGGSGECAATAVVPNPVQSLDSELSVVVEYTYEGPIVSLIGLIPGASLALGTMSSRAVMKYE